MEVARFVDLRNVYDATNQSDHGFIRCYALCIFVVCRKIISMIWKANFLLAGLVAISIFSTNAFPQGGDIKGCWRVERHVLTLTNGSSRQEKDRCVHYYGDTELSLACNSIRDPDYRASLPYQLKKQGAASVLSFGKDPYRQEVDYEIRKGDLAITSRYQRPIKINENDSATSKTSILIRLDFLDRDKCLSQAKNIPQEVIKPVQLAPGVIDFPRPSFMTKIQVADFGSIRWLDVDHVAVTAANSEKTYGQGRIVSIDISNKSITTLLESGFLWRTNPEAALVAVTKGKIMQGNDSSSAEVFYRWDRTRNSLVDEEKPPKPSRNGRYWNWNTCAETLQEDSKTTFFKEFTGKAYLRPEDGVLNWDSSPPPPQGFPVSLIQQKGLRKPLDLHSNEVIGGPVYFPFLKGYVLMGGQFITGGGAMDYRGKKVDQIPLITLRSQSAVIRSYVPTLLKTFLDKWTSIGQIFPAAEGLLIYVGGFSSQGAGLYLSKGDSSTRVWCSPLNYSDGKCNLTSLEVSPDGCSAVIVPQDTKSPVILSICNKE